MEVRERILRESESLFTKYGIKSITIDDLARHLSISKKTIYQFFTDKDDLVYRVTENHIGCIRTAMEKIFTCKKTPKSEFTALEKFMGLGEFLSTSQPIPTPR